MSSHSEALAVQLGELLLSRQFTVTCAESCTGGGVASAITSAPGSSRWFHSGFITYADQSKQQLLGVPPEVLLSEGAVSKTVVELMANGALKTADADIAVAISGIAGPGGGSPDKPVGLVWLCWVMRGANMDVIEVVRSFQFQGGRSAIRMAAIEQALMGLVDILKK